MRGPGRVGWAWIEATSLAAVLGAAGYWVGGGPGAGIGVAAGVVAPLLVERATRRQEAVASSRDAQAVPRRYGPAHLLEPALGVVPFTGRAAELADLEGWCLDELAGLVRLVTGGGGTGKTRLALELCRRMAGRGWQCVQVDEGTEGEVVQLERLAAGPGARLLLVVDYAEARPRLEELLKAGLRDEGRARVLLLARHAGDWWQRLGAGSGAVRDAVAEADRRLMPLAGDLGPQLTAQEVVRRAVPFFAARLGVPVPDAVLVTEPTEGEPLVLDLHAAALVAVLESQQTPAGTGRHVDTGTVLETLLGHEAHYWRGRAEAAGLLGGLGALSMAQLSQVAAAGCLLGAGTAGELSRRLPQVAVTEAVALWLRELYPPDRDGALGGLRPDRLAELLVARELAASPALAEACLTGLTGEQARRALILLARASGDHPAAQALLELSVARFSDVAAELAAPREVLIAVADTIPYPSLALAPAHAALAARIADTYPHGTAGRAQWLAAQAALLAGLGRPEEALAPGEEAVTIYRHLAAADPGAFLPDFPLALNNQAGLLAELGRLEEALAASEEAVAIRHDQAAASPDVFLPDLAMALTNQSLHLSALGRPEEALAASEEAVTAYRDFAASHPDAFLPDLANALTNQSGRLAGLGRLEEALSVIEEAAAIWHDQAAANPDAFLPDFANTLVNLSGCLAELGRLVEALSVIEEAVTIYRDLAATRPDAFLPRLAMALYSQSVCLMDLGRPATALAVIDQTVAINRDLAAARPDASLPDLANALNYEALLLASVGRLEEAAAEIGEAVTVYRRLAAAHPDAFLPELAMALFSQSGCLTELERPEEALTAIEQGVAINRDLAAAGAREFVGRLASSLELEAVILSALGREGSAKQAEEEAAGIRNRTISDRRGLPGGQLARFSASRHREEAGLAPQPCPVVGQHGDPPGRGAAQAPGAGDLGRPVQLVQHQFAAGLRGLGDPVPQPGHGHLLIGARLSPVISPALAARPLTRAFPQPSYLPRRVLQQARPRRRKPAVAPGDGLPVSQRGQSGCLVPGRTPVRRRARLRRGRRGRHRSASGWRARRCRGRGGWAGRGRGRVRCLRERAVEFGSLGAGQGGGSVLELEDAVPAVFEQVGDEVGDGLIALAVAVLAAQRGQVGLGDEDRQARERLHLGERLAEQLLEVAQPPARAALRVPVEADHVDALQAVPPRGEVHGRAAGIGVRRPQPGGVRAGPVAVDLGLDRVPGRDPLRGRARRGPAAAGIACRPGVLARDVELVAVGEDHRPGELPDGPADVRVPGRAGRVVAAPVEGAVGVGAVSVGGDVLEGRGLVPVRAGVPGFDLDVRGRAGCLGLADELRGPLLAPGEVVVGDVGVLPGDGGVGAAVVGAGPDPERCLRCLRRDRGPGGAGGESCQHEADQREDGQRRREDGPRGPGLCSWSLHVQDLPFFGDSAPRAFGHGGACPRWTGKASELS
jgi:tetratricopeptide (TPR) repeat protein